MKQKASPASHSIPSAFIFLLIGLFALTSLTLTLVGTRVYRRIADNAAQNGDSQLVLSYLGNRVRTFDSQGSVALGMRDGLSALCLYETLDGVRYETTIYSYKDGVWERFAPTDEAFDPEDGERLVQAHSLDFEMLSPNLLEATVAMPDGESQSIRMALRAGIAEGGAAQ